MVSQEVNLVFGTSFITSEDLKVNQPWLTGLKPNKRSKVHEYLYSSCEVIKQQ